MSLEEWQALRASIKERDLDAEPPMLAPAEAFDDTRPDEEFRDRFHPDHDPGQLGRNSRAVRRLLGSSCAGWRRKPRPEELYDAVRASRPSPRERQLIRTWLQEASREDLLYAWAEGVYTWRELARAVHAAGGADVATLRRHQYADPVMNGRADASEETLDPAIEAAAAEEDHMSTTGFLGTRADVFMDLAITFFVAAPFLMTYAIRLAARGRYRAHRNLQAGLVAAGTVAVLLLEGSIQYGEAMAAYAQSAYYGTPLIRGLFSVHLWVAIPCFIGWCILTGVSWRRYTRVLPGPFSSTHRLCGVVTYAGFWFTCITGVALYVLCYAL